MIRIVAIAAFGLALAAAPALAQDQPAHQPFTATLSNTAPLVFGMSVEEAATALNAPLKYIRGKPGDEVFAAPRCQRGLLDRRDRLFLQFRNGRLSG